MLTTLHVCLVPVLSNSVNDSRCVVEQAEVFKSGFVGVTGLSLNREWRENGFQRYWTGGVGELDKHIFERRQKSKIREE